MHRYLMLAGRRIMTMVSAIRHQTSVVWTIPAAALQQYNYAGHSRTDNYQEQKKKTTPVGMRVVISDRIDCKRIDRSFI